MMKTFEYFTRWLWFTGWIFYGKAWQFEWMWFCIFCFFIHPVTKKSTGEPPGDTVCTRIGCNKFISWNFNKYNTDWKSVIVQSSLTRLDQEEHDSVNFFSIYWFFMLKVWSLILCSRKGELILLFLKHENLFQKRYWKNWECNYLSCWKDSWFI
jgi:hypothetical protein